MFVCECFSSVSYFAERTDDIRLFEKKKNTKYISTFNTIVVCLVLYTATLAHTKHTRTHTDTCIYILLSGICTKNVIKH